VDVAEPKGINEFGMDFHDLYFFSMQAASQMARLHLGDLSHGEPRRSRADHHGVASRMLKHGLEPTHSFSPRIFLRWRRRLLAPAGHTQPVTSSRTLPGLGRNSCSGGSISADDDRVTAT